MRMNANEFRACAETFPTMKSLDSDKKAAKASNNNEAQAAELVEKIDFSNVKIEPLFEE